MALTGHSVCLDCAPVQFDLRLERLVVADHRGVGEVHRLGERPRCRSLQTNDLEGSSGHRAAMAGESLRPNHGRNVEKDIIKGATYPKL